ncbi:MAG: hypothetical protein UX08_C0025G0002 [Candidatus Collierbacteria bacterium GW2011_GWB1_45_35]|uniref:Uncharacterized protein n=2 Tax=Candidatus Collieribacteriota TaxID=1752725 RepID=A0A0G1KNU5_9BACT|nr:MAG: hypothetical protein UW48_C0017G0003 [Microgenomates group bacterium GW2011_GWC1_44_23]KKT85188.1 MAG: hypothetical protein UW84_C0040G0012 [Candidatus Collierbacteria bacterium GW2011_GWA2_44_99]KKT94572.1 MAG: hypothetical protein UW96_C0019G0017 [Candidatus Collierbacteria bacterium GW2011_GWA1_45_15]KKT99646.1 MAG: hypothetical protein UX01_C0008G0014 [Candidatus Collierbacteria bacterium GW2011_GWB2_45_17]KKU04461.1 MAG: hypothetical protein UX08_C0025G0002 [Candidatus Collierbacte
MDFKENFYDDLLGLRGHGHTENFVHDVEDLPKLESIEKEPTPETKAEKQPRFNWFAFVVAMALIGIALLIGVLFPGPLDEFIAIFIINILYGLAQTHGIKISRK